MPAGGYYERTALAEDETTRLLLLEGRQSAASPRSVQVKRAQAAQILRHTCDAGGVSEVQEVTDSLVARQPV
jgi:hypothetical protein